MDETLYNSTVSPRFGRPRPRTPWHSGERLRVVISTWSTDDSKGFPAYREVDAAFVGRRDVELSLIGRAPAGLKLRSIRVRGARRSSRLAEYLKRQHVLLQLTQWESCSNALIEGLNCGLPAVYLESGANPEMAEPYGVPYRGDLDDALTELLPRYDEIYAALPGNPYRIELVAPQYLAILESVAHRLPVSHEA